MSKRILVYGGCGALGRHCVSELRRRGHWVCSVDLSANDEADASVVAEAAPSLAQQAESVTAKVAAAVGAEKLDAVFCVAGGWAGGSASAAKFVDNCDLVLRQSVWTSVIAARLASLHLAAGGLLVLTGAEPALGGTPGMIGYGLAKAAVHQMVGSLAAEAGGLPANARSAAILPVTLDTPMNRKFMGEDKLAQWTPLQFVADLFNQWLTEPPANGALLKLVTKDFKTEVLPA